MQRQWIKSAEMIHTARQTIRNGFTAPIRLQPPPILVSFRFEYVATRNRYIRIGKIFVVILIFGLNVILFNSI